MIKKAPDYAINAALLCPLALSPDDLWEAKKIVLYSASSD